MPGYVTTAGSYRLLRLPLAQAPFNWFFEEIEEICSMEQRIYPADLVQTSSMMSEEILTLPDTMTPVAFPDPVRIEVPGLRYEAVINREDGGLRLSHLIAVTRSRISAEDYREFRKAFHDIRRSGRAWVILEVQP